MSDNRSTHRGSILIVDDEPHVREVLRRILVREGHSCATAANSEEAWNHLQTHDVDLITLDVTMPGESGNGLLQRTHAAFPDISVIMLTAIEKAETAVLALTYGACGFLNKPVDENELHFHVQRGLERRTLFLERRAYTEQLETRVREQTNINRRAHEETIHRLVRGAMFRDEETGSHIK